MLHDPATSLYPYYSHLRSLTLVWKLTQLRKPRAANAQTGTELLSQSRNISCTEPEERGSDAQSLPLAVEKPQQVMEGCTTNGFWTTNFSLLICFRLYVLVIRSSQLLVILKSPNKTLQICTARLSAISRHHRSTALGFISLGSYLFGSFSP